MGPACNKLEPGQEDPSEQVIQRSWYKNVPSTQAQYSEELAPCTCFRERGFLEGIFEDFGGGSPGALWSEIPGQRWVIFFFHRIFAGFRENNS